MLLTKEFFYLRKYEKGNSDGAECESDGLAGGEGVRVF
jgi:hypothetical protein